jgi:hypothetical protein
VLLTALLYWNGVRGEFLGLDHALYQHSPLLEPPPSSGAAPTLPRWLPRAVTTFSLVLDRAVWGPLPSGYRFTNLVLHLLATLAVFALFLQWSRKRLWLALPAALLFAFHPVHVEAVDVVGARGEILGSLFAFLSLLLLDRARRRGGTGGLVPALALFLLASFSTPTALAVPVIVVLHDAFSEGGLRTAASRRWMDWMLFAVTALPAIVLSLIAARPVLPMNAWLAGRAALLMLWLLIVPVPASTYRILGQAHGAGALSLLAIAGAVAVIAATVAAGRRLLRDAPAPGGPTRVEGDLPILYRGMAARARADHHAGDPAAGSARCRTFRSPSSRRVSTFPRRECVSVIAAAIAWAAERLGMRAPRAGARRVPAGRARRRRSVRTARAIPAPRVPERRGALRRGREPASPRSAELRLRLARAASDHGQTDRAIQLLAPVLEMRPNDATLRLTQGNFLRDVHELDKAESEVREALRIDPTLAAAHCHPRSHRTRPRPRARRGGRVPRSRRARPFLRGRAQQPRGAARRLRRARRGDGESCAAPSPWIRRTGTPPPTSLRSC